MTRVKDLIAYIDEIAPFCYQEEWDNSGFLIGEPDKVVKKIGFCLDLSAQALESAKAECVDLIITHHPVIFRAQKSFTAGNIAYEAAAAGISVISAHTCYDAADGGVNDVLCGLLGLENVKEAEHGSVKSILRCGETKITSAVSLAEKTAQVLNTTVRLSDAGRQIHNVAVCGGAGGDLWKYALSGGADAYITGEASHHEILDACAAGLTMIIAGHYETENPAVFELKKRVTQRFNDVETAMLKYKNPVEYIR
ncbi:MAG: Nif3-like dinuclear metal center hexameric protein [Clostridia bacterium]|nr:Nif3-like dinuclear metal center hexameric protein [Clostridia bacterium]